MISVEELIVVLINSTLDMQTRNKLAEMLVRHGRDELDHQRAVDEFHGPAGQD